MALHTFGPSGGVEVHVATAYLFCAGLGGAQASPSRAQGWEGLGPLPWLMKALGEGAMSYMHSLYFWDLLGT